jgi:hypothetical protein
VQYWCVRVEEPVDKIKCTFFDVILFRGKILKLRKGETRNKKTTKESRLQKHQQNTRLVDNSSPLLQQIFVFDMLHYHCLRIFFANNGDELSKEKGIFSAHSTYCVNINKIIALTSIYISRKNESSVHTLVSG